MTNKEKFLAGNNFMYKGIIYRFRDRILEKYSSYHFEPYAACNTSSIDFFDATVLLFGQTINFTIPYSELIFSA